MMRATLGWQKKKFFYEMSSEVNIQNVHVTPNISWQIVFSLGNSNMVQCHAFFSQPNVALIMEVSRPLCYL